jgi:hypothetical protein
MCLVAVLGVVQNLAGQAAAGAEQMGCRFSELYRKSGFTVPGLRGARVLEARRPASTPGFFSTVLQPLHPATMIFDVSCSSAHDGRLEVSEKPITVSKIYKADVHGRVFSYSVDFSRDAIQNGRRIPLASASIVTFYDADGSGVFSLIQYLEYPPRPDYLPDWVKEELSRPTSGKVPPPDLNHNTEASSLRNQGRVRE